MKTLKHSLKYRLMIRVQKIIFRTVDLISFNMPEFIPDIIVGWIQDRGLSILWYVNNWTQRQYEKECRRSN